MQELNEYTIATPFITGGNRSPNIGDYFIYRSAKDHFSLDPIALISSRVTPQSVPSDGFGKFILQLGSNCIRADFRLFGAKDTSELENLPPIHLVGVGAVGIGPVLTGFDRQAIEHFAYLFNKGGTISCRDQESFDALRKQFPGAKVYLHGCPTALWPLERGASHQKKETQFNTVFTITERFGLQREMGIFRETRGLFSGGKVPMVLCHQGIPDALWSLSKLWGFKLAKETPKTLWKFYSSARILHWGSRLHAHMIVSRSGGISFLYSHPSDRRATLFAELYGFPLVDPKKPHLVEYYPKWRYRSEMASELVSHVRSLIHG